MHIYQLAQLAVSVMARALVSVKCLLIFVCLCTFECTAQTFFELTKECIEKQKVYQTIWNRLLEDGEIRKGSAELKNGEKRTLYIFDGEKVKNMKLNEIFTMLQNYHFLNLGSLHNFFEIPIGGENFVFRLGVASGEQIIVYDAGGTSKIKYKDIRKILDKENVKDVAEQMLTSLNEQIGEQTKWTETSPDAKMNMRLLMVLTQVAEAARPTDNSFNKVEEIMTEVKRTEISRSLPDAKKKFIKEINGYKPKRGRVPGSDLVMQSLLQEMADGKISSFEDLFDKFVPTGKAQSGRQMWFDSGFDELPPSKRRKVDPPSVALSDAKEHELQNQVEKAIGCDSNRRRKRSSCGRRRLELIDDSIRIIKRRLFFDTFDESGRKEYHKVRMKVDMSLKDYIKEHLANLRESGLLTTTEKALGTYGAVVNVLASIKYFSQGEFGKGAFSTFQVAHGLGGLTGVNEIVAKVAKKALGHLTTQAAGKIFGREAVQKLSEEAIKAVGESTAKVLGRFAAGLPSVGLALDIYFIASDIQELLDKNSSVPESLRVAHLILDGTTTILGLVDTAVPEFSPIVEPLVIALTIVRLGLDDFYVDINEELSKVKGEDFETQLNAFLVGANEGVFDLLTLGLGRQIRQLQDQQGLDRELLRNMSDPVHYFNVTFQGIDATGNEVGTLDFTAGMYSSFGGFLTVKLNENGSFTVNMPEVPTESGIPTQITRTFSFSHPVTDIVLGVGEVSNPVYRREGAKLWLLFKVQDFSIIDHFEKDSSSAYGTYYGNSKDNNFYAVQGGNKNNSKHGKKQADNCSRTDNFTVQLQSYNYDLYGRAGNDTFFLGPQFSHVTGGEDNDVYYIPTSGGRAIINNFAHDEETDTLFLNVSHSDIVCSRDGWDLVIGYCQTHAVRVKNWFSHGLEEFHRHIYITTADGVVVEAIKTDLNGDQHRSKCVAVSVDRSRSSSGQHLELTGSLYNVKQVIGSNYSDSIVGNEKPNVLNGGISGADYLEGKNGTDTYIVKDGSGLTLINNFAEDNKEDLVIINIPYKSIEVMKDSLHLVLFNSDSDNTKVNLSNWFNGTKWQHVLFTSNDFIRFTVMEDDEIIAKHPFLIDLSDSKNGVVLNLLIPHWSRNVSINSEIAKKVKTVLDSPHDDTVLGNNLNNFLSCSGGSDNLSGHGGRDIYVIDNTCNAVTINNDAGRDLQYDLLLLKCSDTEITVRNSSNDLIISCAIQGRSLDVTLTDWFLGLVFQHLMVKTINKISAFLPDTISELHSSQGRLLPFEVESDEDCNSEHRVINLTLPQFHKCERFVAKTDACSYSIIGNSHNNYIDPGPGNPYGYQYLTGGNGTDTYVMGHKYGLLNVIDNYADDEQVDHLLFEVLFHHIDISLHGDDIILHSLLSNNSVKVNVRNYFQGEKYQHLIVHSANGILFKLAQEYPYMEVLLVDFSQSVYSQILQADESSAFVYTRIFIGSKTAENFIKSGMNTTEVVGGLKNDTILGGPEGEDLIGLDGDDVIDGGPGNDVLYGGDGDDTLTGGPGNDVFYAGMGADTINGSSGSNTVIFSGRHLTGVIVDLRVGLGWKADAEGDVYDHINNVIGSEYNDVLVGNSDDNILKGQGGDDFIVPGSGDDLLQGGRGSDVYFLNDASGHKAINNFAEDANTKLKPNNYFADTDLVVLNNTLWEHVCYHFIGTELQININFSAVNSSEGFSRLLADKAFLMITLALWLENSNYQHMVFSFLDGFKTEDDFEEENHQLLPAIDMITNGSLFQVISSPSSISLSFDYDLMEYAIFDKLSLRLIHIQPNNVTYVSLPLSSSQNSIILRGGLDAGTAQHFSMSLGSCGLTVAMSPLVSTSTLPNLPTDVLVTDRLFNGFKLEWTTPTNETDPFVHDYKYIVKIRGEANFDFRTAGTTFSTFILTPSTQYNVSICSEINAVSHCTSPLTTTTTSDLCSNLLSLPSHLMVDDIMIEQSQIVATMRCDTGYRLIGASRVVCNSSSLLPLCMARLCSPPFIPAHTIPQRRGSYALGLGQSVHWACQSGYWVRAGVTEGYSTCIEGSIRPPLEHCIEKPRCPALTIPQHGSINSSAVALHVGDAVSYQCNSRHSLHGPSVKICVWDGGNETAHWSPPDETDCSAEKYACPSLLPQPQGNYSHLKEHFYPEDTVELLCRDGYYIRDDPVSPERVMLRCHGMDWTPSQQHCQIIIQTGITHNQLDSVTASYWYAVPSLRNRPLPQNDVYYSLACRNVIGEYHHYVALHQTTECFIRKLAIRSSPSRHEGSLPVSPTEGNQLCIKRQIIKCYRKRLAIGSGPSRYEGILSISTLKGNERLCIKQYTNARIACTLLGYSMYSSEIYHSAVSIPTTLAISAHNIFPTNMSCNHRIMCRHSCEAFTVDHGTGCRKSYERESCTVTCNPGYDLVGSSIFTCSNYSLWSSPIPRCDGKW